MQENPFTPPTGSPPPVTEDKRDWPLAKLAWILPLGGVGIVLLDFMLMESAARASRRLFAVLFGLSHTLAMACFGAGLVFTILGFVLARQYRNACRHALGGCAVFVALALLLAALFVLWVLAMSQMGRGRWG